MSAKVSIAKELKEADRISYLDAILILLSIAFGIGYLDIFHDDS
jgi:hypothetical protein